MGAGASAGSPDRSDNVTELNPDTSPTRTTGTYRKPVSPIGGCSVSTAFQPNIGPWTSPTSDRRVGTARDSPAEGMAKNVPNTKYAITTSAPVRSTSHRRSAVTMAIAAPIAPEPSDAIQTQPLPYAGSQAMVTSRSIAMAAAVSIRTHHNRSRPVTAYTVVVAFRRLRETGTGLPARSLESRWATRSRRSSTQSS